MEALIDFYQNGHRYSDYFLNIYWPIFGTAFYLSFLGVGSRVMHYSKPFNVVLIQRYHNLLLCIASLLMFIGTLYETYNGLFLFQSLPF